MGRRQNKASTRSPMTPQQVQEELMDGVTVSTLVQLGVLTPKGGASPSARRKVKQVNHLLEQMSTALDELFERYSSPIIVDMGAGRATVSLALYDRWIRRLGRGRLIAVEARPDLVEKVKRVTEESYPSLEVISGEALSADLPERIHLVLGLHACDQATDHAIARAILGRADYAALVPCCQAEYARLLKPMKSRPCSLDQLWAASHHRREFGAHLTNVTRCLTLRSVGYAVSVTELTGWEHSMKNEFILARRVGRFHQEAEEELRLLLVGVGLLSSEGEITSNSPWLITQLPKLVEQRDGLPSAQSNPQER